MCDSHFINEIRHIWILISLVIFEEQRIRLIWEPNCQPTILVCDYHNVWVKELEYGQSNLANILHTKELSRQFSVNLVSL